MVVKIEHRVGISAPVDDVWELLSDLNGWATWSPIHKKAEGQMHFGAPVHLEEYYEGLGTWEIDGVISDWTPLSHIHIVVPKPFYAGKLIRFFEFDALSASGCAFSIGAVFDGFLSEREGKRYRPFLRAGFEAFGTALKDKIEAEVAANPDAHPPRPIAEIHNARPAAPAKKAPPWQPPKTWRIGAK